MAKSRYWSTKEERIAWLEANRIFDVWRGHMKSDPIIQRIFLERIAKRMRSAGLFSDKTYHVDIAASLRKMLERPYR